MPVATDFTTEELAALAAGERTGYVIATETVASRLINAGLVDRTDNGLKLAGITGLVLRQARDLGLLPRT